MAEVYVQAEGLVGAPADQVYHYVANIRDHHGKFLPPNFSDLHVEQGGVGAGTVFTFTGTGGGRTRGFRMRVDEPVPGRVLTETDTMSSLATTWTFTPEGDRTRVRIETRWDGAAGVPGFFERLFAPRAMRRIYDDELKRLNRYARQQARELTRV
jgi:ribosome-associated toxin RatA of RatAB toxin-antitoxin module